jgi:hypothetical protein
MLKYLSGASRVKFNVNFMAIQPSEFWAPGSTDAWLARGKKRIKPLTPEPQRRFCHVTFLTDLPDGSNFI